jgi:potassium-dependent mechanosensitive channel
MFCAYARRGFGVCRLLASLFFLAFFPAGILLAQNLPAATQTPVPNELAIPVPEIAAKAAELATQLRGLDESLAPETETRPIEEKLPETIQSIVRNTAETQRLSQGQATRDALAVLETSWGSILKQLDAWKGSLTSRATTLEEELQRLSQHQARWEQTRQLAKQSQAPEAVVERVRETAAAIDSTRHNVERRRKQILTLQDSVIAAQVQAQTALEQVWAAQKELVGRILVADSLPLWARIQAARRETGLATSVSASVKANQAAVREFLRAHLIRVIAHVIVIAMIALMLLRARERVADLVKEEPKLIAMSRIYERPLSSALLLGLWVTPWLYPTVPRPVVHLAGLLALVPAIRLLRRLVPPALVPGLYSLALFYLVDRVRALISNAVLAEQAIFLVEMGAAIALSRWLLAPARIEQVRQQTDVQQLHLLTRAGNALTALFAVAAMASILGYTELGRLLGESGLGSIYAGLILLASLEAIDGVLIYVIRSRVFRPLRFVRRHGWLIRQHLQRVSRWLAFAAWLAFTLRLFALLQPVMNFVAAALGAQFSHGNVSLSLGDVLAFCLTIWLAFILSRFLRFVLEEDVYPRVRLSHGMPYAVTTLSHYAIVSLGFLFAMAAIGLDLTRFTILAGALGVGIGFGLQAIVNNFISGLILLFERPIQVGDAIQIGDLFGEVKHIGIRASTVRTWDGAEVIVPNGDFITNQVRNWTLSDRLRRLEIPVGVAYGTDPERVLALLTDSAAKHPAVLKEPPPCAFFVGFGDSSLNFELRAWTDRADQWFAVRSELAVAIHAALRDANIEIPFPQRDLHLRS